MSRVYLKYLFLTAAIVGLFGVLHPRLSLAWPGQRQRSLERFTNQMVRDQNLDARVFWEWREFFSPGSITFNPNVVAFQETQVIYDLPSDMEQLLQYQSPNLTSTEYLVRLLPEPGTLQTIPELQQRTLDQILLKELMGQPFESLFSDSTTRIVRQDNVTWIIFIRDLDTLKSTNGLFDYGYESPQQRLKDRYWLVVTRVNS